VVGLDTSAFKIMECIIQNSMSIGSSIAKGVYADTTKASLWPCGRLGRDFDSPFLERNRWVSSLVKNVRRYDSSLKYVYAFDQTC
jgi:hypothetical protein